MVSVKKLVASALVGVLMFTAVGCNMVEKTQAAIDKTTVATVNGEKIILGEVDSHLKGMFTQLQSQYGDKYMQDSQAAQQILQQRQSVLDSIVTEKVLVAEANKLKIVPSDEELNKKVDEQIKQYKTQYGEENFKKLIDSMGYTEETFKDYLKNQFIAEATLDYATKDVKVTDEDIQKYYDENKQQFVVQAGADVKHLLFPTEEEAQKAYDEIQSGATTFDDLFNKYEKNTDPKKEPIAENLGRVDYNNSNFDPAFMEGLKPLKDGEISKPVKSSFGYHIIQVSNVTDKETQLTLDQAKEQITKVLENQKKKEVYQKDLDQWKKDLNVKTYDDKLKEGLNLSK